VIREIPVVDDGSPLVDLRDVGLRVVASAPPLPLGAQTSVRMPLSSLPDLPDVRRLPHVHTRATLAERLAAADANLPSGIRLLAVEGLRSAAVQVAIHDAYRQALRRAQPWLEGDELDLLTSRFVAPPRIAPHVAGAAEDLTLAGPAGPLDLGTLVDSTPEESGGACYLDSPAISAEAREHRAILAGALGDVGLVNYPTEWWHWSFGDRYWAHVVGHPFAIHGPV